MKRDGAKKPRLAQRSVTDQDAEEKTESVRTEKRRVRGKWIDEHVVLLVLSIVLTIPFAGRGIFYLLGRFGPHAISSTDINLLYLIVSVFILLCFILTIVKFFGRRRKRTRKEALLIVAEMCIPLVYFGLLHGLYLVADSFPQERFCGRGYELYTLGLRDRIESKADIEATRDWLQSLGSEEYGNAKVISSAELPESLRGLKGARAELSADANGNAKVSLMCGPGIMGSWGVVIGMKDMEIPPSDFGTHGEYRLPVEPGVYVWTELE